MLCSNCEVEMEKGLLSGGLGWLSITSRLAKLSFPGTKFLRFGVPWVYAWCCPKCKQITLQRE